jgi:23S rRNA (cytosine1962-C5)-methyltransferase
VFAQAIGSTEGRPEAGDAVEVFDAQGHFLGRGFYSPGSAIAVRIVTRDPREALDDAALARRVRAAGRHREELLGLPSPDTDGFRLVHAEGDDLPGVVADRYGSTVCVQLTTAGTKRREGVIFDALASLPGIDAVVEIPSPALEEEGLEAAPLRTVRGAEVELLSFREHDFRWEVPLALAQKTGFYFDQRENRERVARLARGRSVLDLCTYLGAFALAAARGGASQVTAVDRSEDALEIARRQCDVNGLDAVRFRRGDIRRDLKAWAADGERYDLVILDPPKLAPSRRHRDRSRKMYEAVNAAALELVTPGGLFVTCSCSAALNDERLLRLLTLAARRAGRRLTLLQLGHQGPDHPTPVAFAEGRYLTAAFLMVE